MFQSIFTTWVMPTVASAAGFGSFRDLVNTVGNYISGKIFPIIVAVTVLIFFGNLIFFIVNNKNEAERTRFKSYSINSVIALFIMLTMWGIIGIATKTVWHTGPFIPQLPVNCSQDKNCTQ